MSSPATPQGDLRDRLLVALRDARKPVTLNALAKLLKAKQEPLNQELRSIIDSGLAYAWPLRSQAYWHIAPQDKARQAILAAADTQAYSRTELSVKAAKYSCGLSAEKVNLQIGVLIAGKQLQAVPAFSGSSKLYLRPGNQNAYFKAARAFIEKKIQKAQFNAADFFGETSSPNSADAPSQILEAVKELEPVRGVPVSTLRLRNHFRSMPKQQFDLAALELRKRQEVFLSQHADPYNISSDEKDLLIDGQDGTYYVAIAIR